MHELMNRSLNFVAIDFEADEQEPDIITEIGVAVYYPYGHKNGTIPQIDLAHIIIKENQDHRNGHFVPDHMDYYNGGHSLVLNKIDAARTLQHMIDDFIDDHGGACLVGHDIKGDLNWLDSLGVHGDWTHVFDTQGLISITHGKKYLSLRNCLQLVRQPYAYLHNAGNDAYYTMLLCLCIGDINYREYCGMDQPKTIDAFRAQEKSSPLAVESQRLRYNGSKGLQYYFNRSYIQG